VRFVDDRLAQYRRILPKTAQPELPGDNLLHVPGSMSAVLELAQPTTQGFDTGAVAAGTLVEPLQQSCNMQDSVANIGVVALSQRDMAFFAAGLWHLRFVKQFAFTGTTNANNSSILQLALGLNGAFGVQAFTNVLSRHTHFSGRFSETLSEVWVGTLDTFKLRRVISATLAGDLLTDDVQVFARRFI
jgi:hypothetical protein